MKKMNNVGRRRVFALAILLGAALIAWGDDDAAELGRNASNAIRAAERAMHRGKLEEATARLTEAAELLEKLKGAAPDDRRLKSLRSKYDRVKRTVDKRTAGSTAQTAGKSEPAGKTSDDAKLPAAVTHRLKKVDRLLDRGDEILPKKVSDDWKAKALDAVITQAEGMMTEIEERYGRSIPASDGEVKARTARIAAFKEKIKQFKGEVGNQAATEAKAKAAREKQSAEWLVKLRPYVAGRTDKGYDETKYLIASGTSNTAELMRRKAIHSRLSKLFAAYEKTGFPNGKTDALKDTEEEVARALKGFEAGFASTSRRLLKEADEELARTEAWLDREEKKPEPNLLSQFVIRGLRTKAQAVGDILPAEDKGVQDVRKRLAGVEARAAALRKRHVARTVMQSDKFGGKERGAIADQAVAVLKAKRADAKVLRTTVISADWREETKLEWTDTTRTALRKRTTRSVSAQVAARCGAETLLFTIWIGSDRKADGEWGEVRGHVMFVDPILEKNVNK